ncbi:amidase family protein [Akanthomyces lecanii RCEF 1005]|uniref:Amidase family protein n=1 Tax=Akanthomyces lecanii RCEF 1005 TaxID=1081108 RepID=A0A168BC74_CORDF|nr:amidase family protein [Akanthomyces lecanii RCEF 1005]
MDGRFLEFDVVEASLEDIQAALTTGTVTSVQLVAEYLRRISIYDCHGISLNSVPIINPSVFKEAAASDDRRAAGTPLGPLDGIPYTAKDSFKVKGLTVANGAAAFEDLIASTDAYTIHALRAAGAILLGKTNMPPMAAGGMQRGLYGRAESPYNANFLAAAFASGSSNGSAVSTAASFAAFGLGEETVSSGRSPASNNAVVAYTPSRGNISTRGNWPLYSLCDVVVPHTRSVSDLFGLLDVIAQPDSVTKGDFWRHQALITLPQPWQDKPSSFYNLREGPAFPKLRVAVPDMYITNANVGGGDIDGVYVSDAVLDLWNRAKTDLESLGAEVISVSDFPAVTHYEAYAHIGSEDKLGMPKNWKQVERAQLPALAWHEFLQENDDPLLKSLHGIEPQNVWPFRDKSDPQVQFFKTENAVLWDNLSEFVTELAAQEPPITTQYQVPGLKQAVTAVEELRKTLLEDWMAKHQFDFVVFPAVGDVGHADADVSVEHARHAWTNGVKYSNGNQALRHLGIPSITVPMGVMADKFMPVGLTIVGKAYDDVRILRLGYLYEQASKRRVVPPLTPQLPSTFFRVETQHGRPHLENVKCLSTSLGDGGNIEVAVSGTVKPTRGNASQPFVQVHVDGEIVPEIDIQLSEEDSQVYSFISTVAVPAPPERPAREEVQGKTARDRIMIMVLASVAYGKPTGWLGFV